MRILMVAGVVAALLHGPAHPAECDEVDAKPAGKVFRGGRNRADLAPETAGIDQRRVPREECRRGPRSPPRAGTRPRRWRYAAGDRRGRQLHAAARPDRRGQAARPRTDGAPRRADPRVGDAHAFRPLGDRCARIPAGPRLCRLLARPDRRSHRAGSQKPGAGRGRRGGRRGLRAYALPALDTPSRPYPPPTRSATKRCGPTCTRVIRIRTSSPRRAPSIRASRSWSSGRSTAVRSASWRTTRCTDFGASPVSADYFGLFAEQLAGLIGGAGAERPPVVMMSQGTSGDQQWMDYARPMDTITIDAYARAMALRGSTPTGRLSSDPGPSWRWPRPG